MGKTRLNEAIATSPYTPISILEKLIECEKEKIKNANRDYIVRSSTKNISIANVNIACQKIKMDEKTIHNSIDFFLKCDHTFRTRVIPDVYERNMLNRYKESMGIEEFEKMKKAFVNAKDSLDEISQGKVSRLIYIENYLVEEKEKYDGKTYETMSTYELIREKENIYKSITQDAKDDMEVLYKNITEYLNNYNQINSLIDARAIAEKKEVGIDER
jgi:hypothetical protein